MSSAIKYVPILKGKDGEYGALKQIMFSCRQHIAPLIELLPSDSTSMHNRIRQQAKKLKECWPYMDAPIFVDCHFFPNPTSALSLLMMQLPDHRPIPVVGSSDVQTSLDAIGTIIAEYKRGFCFRVSREAIFDGSSASHIEILLASSKQEPSDVDILFDLEFMGGYDAQLVADVIERINTFSRRDEWRSLILGGGSFPPDLSGIPLNDVTPIRRNDWLLWNEAVESKKLLRLPTFADYGIQNPSPTHAAFSGSANIRYTLSDRWGVFRGDMIKPKIKTKTLSALMKTLCVQASTHQDFCGSGYSWGDEFIFQSAAPRAVASNSASEWKAVGFAHHITYVARQVSNPGAS
jgi:hypothetical protein